MKKALITGITGQDGSFLAEFLLGKGYDVHGTIRRSSVDYRERIAHLEGHPNFHLHYADLGDSMSILQVVKKVKPTEIYNLAAQSHVQVSFDAPEFTADVDATGVLRILEAVRQCDLIDTCRIYQASTSELYGKVEEVPQRETTPFHPYSPYAVAKQYGYWIVKEYREAYNMFCCSGILFNHESERRGETFVTRKITLAAARIAQGKQDNSNNLLGLAGLLPAALRADFRFVVDFCHAKFALFHRHSSSRFSRRFRRITTILSFYGRNVYSFFFVR